MAAQGGFAEKRWYIGGYDINEEGLRALERELGEENCIAIPPVLAVSVKRLLRHIVQGAYLVAGRVA